MRLSIKERAEKQQQRIMSAVVSRKVVPIIKSCPHASCSTLAYDALQKRVEHDWRRHHLPNWTENDLTRANHDRQAGGGWANRYPDCCETGLFGMDGAQVGRIFVHQGRAGFKSRMGRPGSSRRCPVTHGWQLSSSKPD
jgi:hypothetical protein